MTPTLTLVNPAAAAAPRPKRRAPSVKMWTPPPSDPILCEWYHPLARLSRRVRRMRIVPRVHLEDFLFVGRVEPDGDRPQLWAYVHEETSGPALVDDEGAPYDAYEIKPCDLLHALHQAGLLSSPIDGGRDRGPDGRCDYGDIDADLDGDLDDYDLDDVDEIDEIDDFDDIVIPLSRARRAGWRRR